jgi:hypothetical protein
VRAGMVSSDNRLTMICRSISNSTGVDMFEKSMLKEGGLLALTASASAIPSRL